MLRGKNILITAGPTWVSIDKVRVFTNIFRGKTGCLIAKRAREMGANVTFLLGPGKPDIPSNTLDSINIIQFKYFEELCFLVEKEVKSHKYQIMIHSAAVSDYQPEEIFDGKIKSLNKEIKIILRPTVKIIDQIKKYDPSIFLVKFKLEVGLSEEQLISIGFESMLHSKADLIVVNDLNMIKESHKALIIDLQKKITSVETKEKIAEELLNIIDMNISDV